ncbi:MAG: histidyl-tRNA synthetase [uncultured bacterium]|nr:MAG: histidyl-tRNA synthetase [uncultured bacterium]
MFGGRDIPAVGFAFGFDRIIEAMEELSLFPSNLGGTKALVTNTNKKSFEVAEKLRKEGLNIELFIDEKDLDKQLKYADKKQIPYVIIVSEANLRLKNMVTGEQKETNLEDLPDALR